jgi:hypothetical protein
MDFITKLPSSNNYNTILTITDHDILKACILIPYKETIDSVGVAALYANHIFPHYRIPLKVISDHDPHLNSTFTTHLCRLLGIKQNISTTYHPQTDGQSEHTNQSLETYLQLYCDSQQHEWSKLLPLAQYVRNSWPNATTKQAPFNILIGYTPTAHQPTRTTDLPTLQERLDKIKESRSAAQEAMIKSQERSNQGPSHFTEYQVGNKVWLEGTNLKRIEGTVKLSPRQYGPFKVAAKVSHVAYKLDLPDHWRIHNIFHASLLTPYKETPEYRPNYLEPPPNIIDDTPEWEVERILKEQEFRRWRKKQYLVHWKGYSPAHDSWVDSEDMHADDLISDFRQTTPTTIKAATFVSEEPMCPFPPFFSLSALIPGTFEDDESDQGYSDPEEDPTSPGAQYRGPAPGESPPLSPEEYDPAASPTAPLGPYAPSRLQAYDNDPHGGWGPPANWHGQPSTPLSEIMPNPDPWPHP